MNAWLVSSLLCRLVGLLHFPPPRSIVEGNYYFAHLYNISLLLQIFM